MASTSGATAAAAALGTDPYLLTGLGATFAVFLSGFGAAIASHEGGIYAIQNYNKLQSKWIAPFVPTIISGVLAIYGLIIGVILVRKLDDDVIMTTQDGYRQLSSGLCVGLTSFASGYGMSKFLKECNSKNTITMTAAVTEEQTQPLLPSLTGGIHDYETNRIVFIHTILNMIFLESIGLYGLIMALLLAKK
jgi:V-type H+-transporting ATPase proteolipid subunit